MTLLTDRRLCDRIQRQRHIQGEGKSTHGGGFMFLAVLLQLVAAVRANVLPGVKGVINGRAFGNIVGGLMGSIDRIVSMLDIAPVSLTIQTPLGDLELGVAGISVTRLGVNKSSAGLATPRGIRVIFSDVDLEINLNWTVKQKSFPFLSFSGGGSASTKRTVVNIDVQLGTDASGHVIANCSDVSLDLPDARLEVTGAINTVRHLLPQLVRSLLGSVVDAISDAIKKAANTILEEALSTISTEIVLAPLLMAVDIGLTEAPHLDETESNLVLPLSGEFFNLPDGKGTTPSTRTELPSDSGGRMAQVYVGQFVLDSIGYAMYQSSLFNLTLTKENVHHSVAEPLFVSGTYVFFAPTIMDIYGADAAVHLHVRFIEPPRLAFERENGLKVAAPVEIDVLIHNDNTGEMDEAFALRFDADIGNNIFIRGDDGNGTAVVYGNLTSLDTTVSVLRSSVGDVSTAPASSAAAALFGVVQKRLNPVLEKGMALPSLLPGLTLVEPELRWNDGYASVATDVDFHLADLLTAH